MPPTTRTQTTNHGAGKSGRQPAARTRGKKNKLHHLEEYDEDPGRAGSEKYQILAKAIDVQAAKSKDFLRDFRKEVERKGLELKAFCQDKEKELTEDQGKIGGVIKQISQQLIDGKHGRLDALRKEDHPLFQRRRAQREEVSSFLKGLETMEETQLESEKLALPVSTWEQDEINFKEVLAYGSSYGEVLLGNALAPYSMGSTEIDQLGSSEKEQLVKDLFKGVRRNSDQETWGEVAEDSLRQVTAIARTIPLEEERFQ
ncbi:hypothetical protein F5B22DRAFT_276376 [Xylaria bambusicola]|uniref:uncharacterized protein n=1 Tax=Xylaria bambusicola TaxID=326684 RepID=UPI002007F371|nr:uncharacterized protein F5B22DRAFT_276376 [Xylaria bambusicola]KAI0513165.1 hypothetical protein F5B22DRAFT_276376 [Xylaria bambusicola]